VGKNGGKKKFKMHFDGSISFSTLPDEEYVIRPAGEVSSNKVSIYSGTPNKKAKFSGSRILGKTSGWNDNPY
jgi:hypothetical protein